MMTHYSLIALLLILTLPACSTSLKVQVDIFDPKGVTADDALLAAAEREASKHAYLLKTDKYRQAITDLKTQVKSYIAFLSSPEIAVMTSALAVRSEQTASQAIEQRIDSAMQARENAVQELRKATSSAKAEDKRAFLTASSSGFSAASKQLTDLRSSFLKPYEGPLREHIATIKSAPNPDFTKLDRITAMQNASESSLEKNLQSLTGGLDLLDDPLAPAIIAAPPQYWQGLYNKTDATGTIGNTDIAIKMETIGTFTIKGLRLDASKVTEATFDVLKQTVRMVAAAYGIPIPASPSSTTSPDSTNPANTVSSIDQLRDTAERKRLLSRSAALTILDLMVANKDNLEDSNQRKTAVQQLKKSFEAYKGQLSGT